MLQLFLQLFQRNTNFLRLLIVMRDVFIESLKKIITNVEYFVLQNEAIWKEKTVFYHRL